MSSPGRATVQGLGHFGGGVGVARFLVREGWEVTVTDLQSAEQLADSIAALEDLDLRLALGGHDPADFTHTDLVVANPAVDPEDKHLRAARAAGVRIVTEIGLFLERCPARVAAVTGTQGKSSTAHFLHQLLVAADIPARIGGNIGGSLLGELREMRSEELCIVELSSYQLVGLSCELAEATLDLSGFTGTAMLVHHVRDARNYDFLALDKPASGEVMLRQGRVEDGRETTMDEGAAPLDGPAELKAYAVGTHFRGYLGGEQLTHPHGPAAPPGRVGLRLDGAGTARVLALSATPVE